MVDIREAIKKMDQAWVAKDDAAIRELLHADYECKGPLMAVNGIEQAIMGMNFFPFVGKNENEQIIVEGNKAAYTFDWVLSSPFQATIPITEIIEFEDEKIRKVRIFFDTGLFPGDMVSMIKTMAGMQ